MADKSINKAFTKSLYAYMESNQELCLWTGVTATAADVAREFETAVFDGLCDHDLARTFNRLFAAKNFGSSVLEAISQDIESPIEILLLFALCIIGKAEFDEVWIDPARSLWQPRMDRVYHLLSIQPQESVAKYRVDFMVRLYSRVFLLRDGKEETKLIDRSVIVECDGHDFHERTKEQASHDKRRDRFLQGSGFNILHFTGSDIWKDVFACAGEVVHFLKTKITEVSGGEV